MRISYWSSDVCSSDLLATFAVGYGETLKNAVKGLVSGTAGEPTEHALRGNSLKPEFLITAKGDLTMANGQVVSPSSCLGCWTPCGVRVRVDTDQNRIVRLAGNPYPPLATTHPPPMDTPDPGRPPSREPLGQHVEHP